MLNMDNQFNYLEQDSKLLVKSLLGLILKNYGKTQDEKMEGLKLMEQSQKLSDEIKIVYERLKWLMICPDDQSSQIVGMNRPDSAIR